MCYVQVHFHGCVCGVKHSLICQGLCWGKPVADSENFLISLACAV